MFMKMLALFPLLTPAAALANPGVDLIYSDISAPCVYTPGAPINGRNAYSFFIQFCNIGDQPAPFAFNSNLRPAGVQGAHRIANGVIEQIGLSWAAHANFVWNMATCGTCPVRPDQFLGPQCGYNWGCNENAGQSLMASRAEINAATGALTVPSLTMPLTGNDLYKRLQILQDDLLVPNALFYIDAVLVHPHDAAAGNADNNTTHRRVIFDTVFQFNPTLVDSTVPEQPVVNAWKANALGLGVPDPNIRIVPVHIPSDGVIYLAARAHKVSPTTWQYTYVIQNVTSDRSVQSLSIPCPPTVTLTNNRFSAPQYHSGEVFSNDPWTFTQTANTAGWATQTFDQNQNANAVRWGTLYTYSFQSEAPPVYATVSANLFKPGSTPVQSAPLLAPGPHPCPGDSNGDGLVNFADINFILSNFGAEGVALPGDVNADGVVNFADLNLTLSNYANAC